MRLCLEHGADVNWANEEGETVLYDACKNGHVDAARLLLDKGADASRVTKKGTTPLAIAKRQQHYAVVALLKEFLAASLPRPPP